ncbi:ATP-grasp 4 domain containing protein [Trichuris trichiura]|uniref:ATP-grasp 4 domain containing protein n=1 Tax=Trichuris trichiura TaxID=36087 RepID=A0A077ZAW4_TRITR|nr:ATP-grasp 4 domain containing protein [Trichuris trichiura]
MPTRSGTSSPHIVNASTEVEQSSKDYQSIQLSSLRQIAKEGNSRCLIVLKARKAFTTDLIGLRQACGANTLPILLASDKVFSKLTAAQKGQFFLIITYPLMDEEKKSQCWCDLTEVSYKEVGPKLRHLLRHVQASQCSLVVSEEPLVYYAAKLRRQFKIPGAQPDDILRFTNKASMRITLSRFQPAANGPTVDDVKFCSMFTGRTTMTSAQFERLLLDAGLQYPLVLKPQSSCGSFDVQIVRDRTEVHRWHSEHGQLCKPYIAEEMLAGDQYAAYMLIFQGKIQWFRIYRNRRPIVAFVRDRLPLAKLELCQEDDEYAAHCAYVNYLATAFSPIPDGMFTAEYFRRPNGNFQFLENCIRLPGGPLVTLVQLAERMNLEVAHLSGQYFSPATTKATERVLTAYIRYPTRRGVITSIRQPPETLRSRVYALWRVQVGQRTEDPVELSGKYVALQLLLLNTNYGHLKADFTTCMNEYEPFEILKD